MPLTLDKKSRKLVGLGSYLVNTVGDCNGCHSAGPVTEYTPDGNPYLLAPVFSGKKKVNPDKYLGGGFDFGPLVPGSPNIVTRNLTPDKKSGLPEGGATYAEFHDTMRHGTDHDNLHPSCSTNAPNCLPFPFNGSLLQVMPWPSFQDMSEHDLRAIYEYLSAVPCIPGGPLPGHDC